MLNFKGLYLNLISDKSTLMNKARIANISLNANDG